MLKIDTEGAELMVLLGCANFITSQSPEIFLELSSHTEDFGLTRGASQSYSTLGLCWGNSRRRQRALHQVVHSFVLLHRTSLETFVPVLSTSA